MLRAKTMKVRFLMGGSNSNAKKSCKATFAWALQLFETSKQGGLCGASRQMVALNGGELL